MHFKTIIVKNEEEAVKEIENFCLTDGNRIDLGTFNKQNKKKNYKSSIKLN